MNLPKWAPKRVFVQEVLEREVRLSYWDKVKQVMMCEVHFKHNCNIELFLVLYITYQHIFLYTLFSLVQSRGLATWRVRLSNWATILEILFNN